MSEPGSTPLYRDGRHYDAFNRHMVADIPFYVEEARRAAGPVLELACGTGRLAIPIAQSGVEIVGLDQSPSMLAHLRTKAKEAGVEIPLVEADCRAFDLGRKFALIFIGFNSMQHLHDLASLAALFANVRRHLAPGGKFVFDVFNPSIAILTRDAERSREREYEDPDAGGRITMDQTLVYDDATQVSHVRWFFSRNSPNGDERDFRIEDLRLRCFFPQELDLLVRSQGFEIEAKCGNFERKPFASGDQKQVVVCRSKWESVSEGCEWSEICANSTGLREAGFFVGRHRGMVRERGKRGPHFLTYADFYQEDGICFGCCSTCPRNPTLPFSVKEE